MTDRIPLVVDSSNFRIEEIPSGDNVDFNATSLKNVSIVGVATVAAGSTTSPSISPSGDSNTGIFFPSADTIAVSAGGSERFRASSAGVGIGTTDPTVNVQIGPAGGTGFDTASNLIHGVQLYSSGFVVENPNILGVSTTTVFVTSHNDTNPLLIAADVIVSAQLQSGFLLLGVGGFMPVTNNQKIVAVINSSVTSNVSFANTTKIVNGVKFDVGITTGNNRAINIIVAGAGTGIAVSFASTIT